MNDLKHLFVIDDEYNVYEVVKLIKGYLKDEIDYMFKLYDHKYSITEPINCKNSIILYVNNKETISDSYYYVKIKIDCISNFEFFKNMHTYHKEYNCLLSATYTTFIHNLEYLSSSEFADIISNYVKTIYERIKNLESGSGLENRTDRYTKNDEEVTKWFNDRFNKAMNETYVVANYWGNWSFSLDRLKGKHFIYLKTGEKENMFNTIKSITVNKEKRIVTCVFIDDDVRMSKCSSEDEFDVYVGVALCIAQHTYRSKTKFKKAVDKLTEKKRKG